MFSLTFEFQHFSFSLRSISQCVCMNVTNNSLNYIGDKYHIESIIRISLQGFPFFFMSIDGEPVCG
jgi:hypothetical protein